MVYWLIFHICVVSVVTGHCNSGINYTTVTTYSYFLLVMVIQGTSHLKSDKVWKEHGISPVALQLNQGETWEEFPLNNATYMCIWHT